MAKHEWLTPVQIAAVLGVTVEQLWQLVQRGEGPPAVGRKFRARDFEQWLGDRWVTK